MFPQILSQHIAMPAPQDTSEKAKILRALEAALARPDIDIDTASAATRKAADAMNDLAVQIRTRHPDRHDAWLDAALAMGALRSANAAMWRADADASLAEQRRRLGR